MSKLEVGEKSEMCYHKLHELWVIYAIINACNDGIDACFFSINN